MIEYRIGELHAGGGKFRKIALAGTSASNRGGRISP